MDKGDIDNKYTATNKYGNKDEDNRGEDSIRKSKDKIKTNYGNHVDTSSELANKENKTNLNNV